MPLAEHRLRLLLIAGLAAALLTALTVAFWPRAERGEANVGTPAMQFRLSGNAEISCDNPAAPTKCSLPASGTFNLDVAIAAFPADTDGPPTGPCPDAPGCSYVEGYIAMTTDVDWTGTALTYKPQPNSVEVPWPDRGNLSTTSEVVSPTRVRHSDFTALSGGLFTPSTFKGVIVQLQLNCSGSASSNAVLLRPFNPGSNPSGARLTNTLKLYFGEIISFPMSDSITINCVAPSTPTPTPTATPNPVPRMQKLPALQNLFLTRQGSKIPPLTCLASDDVAVLTESISIPIAGIDPKDPSQPQQLGGFSFQVKYDPQKVCVTLSPGPAWTQDPQQVCTVEDSLTAPTLQGIARINCVTLGKATVVDTSSAAGRVLASIEVRPQPEAYSVMKPNQDNGNAVQINNELCKLTDLQGHAIPVFSCEDADVTIRFLEGDVEPDCAVNTLDTQAVAFRWGATKGGLVYNERFNLEPSGTQADQDIDVSDLQFVYGRFGSTCALPWPGQLPVNPKA